MHVLLAGATGDVGRRIVPLLLARGHRVTGLTRSVERAEGLRVAGACAAVVDVTEGSALRAVVRASAPDGILHQLTDLTGEDRSANARLRVVGTRNLVNGARAAGVTRIVAQRFAFAYEDGLGSATEDVALRPGTPGIPGLEAAAAELPDWVVQRYGLFYGSGTRYAPDGVWAQRARAGELIADESVTSWIHVDDAAAAAVAALGWPSGVYNVCDDEPATGREWVPVFCAAVCAPPPPRAAIRIPGARGADNGGALALGWRPAVLSWRTGFRAPAGAAS
jgi:nucleoside-diphosphate-sugar epimerase